MSSSTARRLVVFTWHILPRIAFKYAFLDLTWPDSRMRSTFGANTRAAGFLTGHPLKLTRVACSPQKQPRQPRPRRVKSPKDIVRIILVHHHPPPPRTHARSGKMQQESDTCIYAHNGGVVLCPTRRLSENRNALPAVFIKISFEEGGRPRRLLLPSPQAVGKLIDHKPGFVKIRHARSC